MLDQYSFDCFGNRAKSLLQSMFSDIKYLVKAAYTADDDGLLITFKHVNHFFGRLSSTVA